MFVMIGVCLANLLSAREAWCFVEQPSHSLEKTTFTTVRAALTAGCRNIFVVGSVNEPSPLSFFGVNSINITGQQNVSRLIIVPIPAKPAIDLSQSTNIALHNITVEISYADGVGAVTILLLNCTGVTLSGVAVVHKYQPSNEPPKEFERYRSRNAVLQLSGTVNQTTIVLCNFSTVGATSAAVASTSTIAIVNGSVYYFSLARCTMEFALGARVQQEVVEVLGEADVFFVCLWVLQSTLQFPNVTALLCRIAGGAFAAPIFGILHEPSTRLHCGYFDEVSVESMSIISAAVVIDGQVLHSVLSRTRVRVMNRFTLPFPQTFRALPSTEVALWGVYAVAPPISPAFPPQQCRGGMAPPLFATPSGGILEDGGGAAIWGLGGWSSFVIGMLCCVVAAVSRLLLFHTCLLTPKELLEGRPEACSFVDGVSLPHGAVQDCNASQQDTCEAPSQAAIANEVPGRNNSGKVASLPGSGATTGAERAASLLAADFAPPGWSVTSDDKRWQTVRNTRDISSGRSGAPTTSQFESSARGASRTAGIIVQGTASELRLPTPHGDNVSYLSMHSSDYSSSSKASDSVSPSEEDA
jgi:hypothetical protein